MRGTRQNQELEHRLTNGDRTGRSGDSADSGFTLIELMIAILLMGIIASIVVVAATGMRTDATDASCDTDRRIVGTAAEAYFSHTLSSQIPATGTDHDRYEQTLVDGGYLRAASDFYDLDADGVAAPQEDSSC
jgi:prepilin-type N-terminal cleavage/methylation domain-containing protein